MPPRGKKAKKAKKAKTTTRRKKASKGRRGGGVVRRAIKTIAKHPAKVAGAVAAAAALAGGAHALMTGSSTLPQDTPGQLIVDKDGWNIVGSDGSVVDAGWSFTPAPRMPPTNSQGLMGNISRITPPINYRPRYRSKASVQARAAKRAEVRAKIQRGTAEANPIIPSVY